MKKIWVIDEGSPGHANQSLGLAEALAPQIDGRVVRVTTTHRFRGCMRSVLRIWIGVSKRPLPSIVLNRWLDLRVPEDAGEPALILSSGGKSVFAGRSLALRFGVPYVFVGERKPYPRRWFHTVFTPSAAEAGEGDQLIESIPTRMSPRKVAEASREWELPEEAERPWALVIGGPSRSHGYATDEWDALAEAVNRIHRAHGVRWLVTTSQRTGAAIENRLRQQIDPAAIAYAIWWCQKPEKRLAAILGRSARVLVTQDSVSMVSEAVDAGCPVTVLAPRVVRYPADSFLPAYFQRMERAGLISRDGFSLEQSGATPTTPVNVDPSRQTAAEDLAKRLIQRLALKSSPDGKT